MYDILIVDDDLYIRKDIQNNYSLDKHGFRIAGEAANGKAALDLFQHMQFDIILCDMRMPTMGGVAFIEEVKRAYPETQVIAMSGYDDFDYVSASLKMGAVDYLLKHRLNEEALVSTLRAAAARIEQARHIKSERSALDDMRAIMHDVEIDNWLKRLLDGGFASKQEAEQGFNGLGLGACPQNMAMIVFELDDMSELERRYTHVEMASMIKNIISILRELHKVGFLIHIFQGRFVYIIPRDMEASELTCQKLVADIIYRIRLSLKRFFNMSACYAVINRVKGIMQLGQELINADNTLGSRFYRPKDQFMTQFPAAITKTQRFIPLPKEREGELLESVLARDRVRAQRMLEALFNYLWEEGASSSSYYAICLELLNALIRAFPGATFAGMTMENFVQELYHCGNVADIRGMFTQAILQLASADPAPSPRAIAWHTLRALAYIDSNFTRALSLDEVACYVGINKAYLSRLFAKDMGKNIVSYINELRIEKATEYLKNPDYSIREIAGLVGFDSYTYFFKVFKSIKSTTPQSYRDSVLSK